MDDRLLHTLLFVSVMFIDMADLETMTISEKTPVIGGRTYTRQEFIAVLRAAAAGRLT